MTTKEDLFRLLKDMNKLNSISNANRTFDMLFEKIDFKDKIILDIGGGIGTYSFYASIMGAKKVICLEPQLEGGKNSMHSDFEQLKNTLKIYNVVLISETIQDYNALDKIDIVLSMASINHFDEDATINLIKNENARCRFIKIFEKIYNIMKNEGIFIISDVARRNLWGDLKLRNPFAPAIEWHKHQSPSDWYNVAMVVGFKKFKTKWVAASRISEILPFGNKILAYFFSSHFDLYLRK